MKSQPTVLKRLTTTPSARLRQKETTSAERPPSSRPIKPVATKEKLQTGEEIRDGKSLTIDLLVKGYIQSFIDLFFFISRYEKKLTYENPIEETPAEIPFKDEYDSLNYIKEKLEVAEGALLAGHLSKAADAYEGLALLDYACPKPFKVRIYFFDRAVALAKEVFQNSPSDQSRTSLARIQMNLGKTYFNYSGFRQAIREYEEVMSLKSATEDLESDLEGLCLKTAGFLVTSYLAEAAAQDQHPPDVALHKRCLAWARRSSQSDLQAKALYALGRTLLVQFSDTDHLKEAEDLLLEAIKLYEGLTDMRGTMLARASLAKIFDLTGRFEETIGQLQAVLNVAQSLGDLQQESDARYDLSLLFFDKNELTQTTKLAGQHFDLCRQLMNREHLEKSRVLVGMAKGHALWSQYLGLVTDPSRLKDLLQWKSTHSLPDTPP